MGVADADEARPFWRRYRWWVGGLVLKMDDGGGGSEGDGRAGISSARGRRRGGHWVGARRMEML